MEKHEKEVKNSDDPTALADDINKANSNSNSNSTSDYIYYQCGKSACVELQLYNHIDHKHIFYLLQLLYHALHRLYINLQGAFLCSFIFTLTTRISQSFMYILGVDLKISLTGILLFTLITMILDFVMD